MKYNDVKSAVNRSLEDVLDYDFVESRYTTETGIKVRVSRAINNDHIVIISIQEKE